MKEYKYRRRPVWRKRKSDVIAEAIMEISVAITDITRNTAMIGVAAEAEPST